MSQVKIIFLLNQYFPLYVGVEQHTASFLIRIYTNLHTNTAWEVLGKISSVGCFIPLIRIYLQYISLLGTLN